MPTSLQLMKEFSSLKWNTSGSNIKRVKILERNSKIWDFTKELRDIANEN